VTRPGETEPPSVDANAVPDPNHARDLELVRSTLAGRPDAVEEFVDRMRTLPALLRVRNVRLGRPLSDDDLSDLVQDSVAVVWRKLGTFAGRSSLETWAYRIGALELMNAVRRKGRQLQLVEEPDALEGDETVEGPARGSAGGDHEKVHASLERLSPAEREAIRMKHFEQLTFDEIGARLEQSPNTAKTHYYRGMTKLRVLLLPHRTAVEGEA